MALVRAHMFPTAESNNDSKFSIETTIPVTLSEIRRHIMDINEFYGEDAMISIQVAALDPRSLRRMELREWALADAGGTKPKSLFDFSAYASEGE